jgi:hypothetical protein
MIRLLMVIVTVVVAVFKLADVIDTRSRRGWQQR